ncbi:MAG: hypothetical protein IKP71_02005, partial [Candidatus Riflebacteria bacterium]|nr:hypothetical protein [Candidatus Riflebacteria bacterium]
WGTGEAFAGGDYYITREFINGHTAAEGKLTEGSWYLHVKAEDKSGNVTTVKIPLYVINSNASFETSSK